MVIYMFKEKKNNLENIEKNLSVTSTQIVTFDDDVSQMQKKLKSFFEHFGYSM